jgi:hypothetical protein
MQRAAAASARLGRGTRPPSVTCLREGFPIAVQILQAVTKWRDAHFAEK